MKKTQSQNLLATWFSLTSFLSAALLFSVQPMVAKMLLPLLGGSPAVWNTCLVFFQAALLAGYAYAHFCVLRLARPRQKALHVALMLAAVIVLPIRLSANDIASIPYESNPSLWLLGSLLGLVGLPFFVVSSSAPILQKWFSETDHPHANDPYFLYAASNLGSLLALIAYPVLIEPRLTLQQQSRIWAGGYALLIALFAWCAVGSWRTRRIEGKPAQPLAPNSEGGSAPELAAEISPARRLRWVLLAFIPSSLMLGVTNHLSTDIAAIPLLWIVPLALYLLTFILAFAQKPLLPGYGWDRAVAIGTLSLLYIILSQATQPITLLIIAHFAVFFALAFFCHARLSYDRPPPANLTDFYLWISVGGVLGGVFNSLLAPNIFKTVVEYPLVLALACLLRRKGTEHSRARTQQVLDWALPFMVGLVTILLAIWIPVKTQFSFQAQIAIIFGIPLVFSYMLVERPLRFALGIAAVLFGSQFYPGPHGRTLHLERNFFGVARVTLDPNHDMHRMVHGTTIHGKQSVVPGRECEPLSYYTRSGPVGLVFEVLNTRPSLRHVAITGLGAGSMAAYSRSDQEWTYYEIDPTVIRIARNTNYFSYLGRCAAGKLNVMPGDARLRIQEAPAKHYGLIVLDAFSSDSIPTHLLTRQAVDLYLSKLADGGMLLFHISNRYLDLKPVLADLALDRSLVAFYRAELDVTTSEALNGKDPSEWVIMARQAQDLGALSVHASIWAHLAEQPDWQPLYGRTNVKVWSDDFSDLLSIFKWR